MVDPKVEQEAAHCEWVGGREGAEGMPLASSHSPMSQAAPPPPPPPLAPETQSSCLAQCSGPSLPATSALFSPVAMIMKAATAKRLRRSGGTE